MGRVRLGWAGPRRACSPPAYQSASSAKTENSATVEGWGLRAEGCEEREGRAQGGMGVGVAPIAAECTNAFEIRRGMKVPLSCH